MELRHESSDHQAAAVDMPLRATRNDDRASDVRNVEGRPSVLGVSPDDSEPAIESGFTRRLRALSILAARGAVRASRVMMAVCGMPYSVSSNPMAGAKGVRGRRPGVPA